MQMNRETFLEVLDRTVDLQTGGRVESYSGRGMYGKRCIAYFGDAGEWGLAMAMGYVARSFGHDPRDIPEPNTDSLGHGIVLYWPRYEWPEERNCPSQEEDED